MLDLWDIFLTNLNDTTWFEGVAAVLGIASVWYARRENILVYPTGIVSVLIYVYICYSNRLYADAGINFFYAIMSVYGWYNWTRNSGDNNTLEISANNRRQQIAGISLTIVSYWAIIGLIWMLNFNDKAYMSSYVPWVDSFTTSIFLVGMLLMARKKVENWIYWIIADVVSIPLYFYKGLVFTSFQYIIFLILAILGYIEWRNRWKENKLS
ncbi:MAG: nicotinamide riboside transporter PnuC [Lentimicrobium sp.]|jgi:nicotinamide mononucleotide transporter|nr:nicotinamide riboside transporter PnuC [Lentimicrobium sp.]